MSIFDLFVTRKLSSVLTKTFRVKVQGVKFELKKLNPLDYMNGSKALTQAYDTYKSGGEKADAALLNVGKIREHYIDVFMGSVVSPKLTRKKEDTDGLFVEHLLTDWSLATDLYEKIMEITYGKKKMRSLISLKKNS